VELFELKVAPKAVILCFDDSKAEIPADF
jgi:hypothetical protein